MPSSSVKLEELLNQLCLGLEVTTVKFLNFGMPKIFAVITLKFKQIGVTIE